MNNLPIFNNWGWGLLDGNRFFTYIWFTRTAWMQRRRRSRLRPLATVLLAQERHPGQLADTVSIQSGGTHGLNMVC